MLSFLKRMAAAHPDDAEACYWLGKEYGARQQWVEAIGQWSAGLTHCSDEQLKAALLAELAAAAASMQQGSAQPAIGEAVQQGSAQPATGEAMQQGSAQPAIGEAMQQGSAQPAIGEAVRQEGAQPAASGQEAQQSRGSKTNIDVTIDMDDDGDKHGPDFTEGPQPDEDGGEAGGQSADSPSASGRSAGAAPQLYARSAVAAGLKVLDGGRTEARPDDGNRTDRITFSDVAGLQELKKTIQLRIISPFHNQGLFAKFRKKIGGGVLLYGPPGCGKTFIAKATAGECRASFLPVHITDILDKYIGESEQNLKALFDKARNQRPSIMFFDEIDTIGYSRAKSTSYMRGTVDTFLMEMEGIDTSTDQVLVIGATNMPWDVDDALKRPGRFDRLVFVGPPDEEAREQMFRLKLAGRYTDTIDTCALARRTELFSGADIEHLCERAAEAVLSEILETGIERPIRMDDFEALLPQVKPSTLEWLHKAKNYVKYANQSGIYNEVEDFLRKYGRQI